ncbi:hypothetical protein BDR05DRAFT_966864 [Suillus weaverae]|nr:hypothetical protein BDR05DRAFT_966864 [Suillus weaverae]
MSRPLSKFHLLCLQILDLIFLLQVGRTYLARFSEFAEAAKKNGLQAVDRWRVEQQAEWDRLSNTLAFLVTMSATDSRPHSGSPSRFLCLTGNSWVERLRSFHCSVLPYLGVLSFERGHGRASERW